MRKKRILQGLGVLLIIGIGVSFMKKPEDQSTPVEKIDFVVQTIQLGNSENNAAITKNGKIEGISDITLSAQTAGRISRIEKKIGDKLQKNAFIGQIEDTQGSSTFRAESSAIAVQSAENNYQVQKQNLEKQIADLLLAKERAELNFTNTAGGEVNNTLLQIEGLEKSLEKARLDYDTKVANDEITLNNNIITAKNIYSDTLNLLIDVLDQSDKLLGVTEANRRLASDYDIYLGGRNVDIRKKAENELRRLFAKREELQQLGNDITLENINTYLAKYKDIVREINDFTVTMKDVFINSLEDVRFLPKAMLDGYIASFGGLQSKASGITASITNQTNGLRLFVESYKPNQESLKKQIEILENDILVRQTQLEEAAKNSEINLRTTENNLDFAVSTKDINLETIENNLRAAQVALREAEFNISKFVVQSPIDGIISDILVDVGQEVTPGTPLVKIVSNGKGIKLSLSEKEVVGIKVGQTVTIKNDTNTGTGVVTSVGVVGDKNGNFPVEIFVEDGDFVIGTYADVTIPMQRGSSMIPLNAVSIIDNNIGQIVVWDGEQLSTKRVALGIVLGQSIEVVDAIPNNYKIIISDVRNYDKDKMNLIIE